MKLSDCPYPVGTPEHSEWVKYAYIPHTERTLVKADQPGAAEQQGRRLLHGDRYHPDGTERATPRDKYRDMVEDIWRQMQAGAFAAMSSSADRARNDFQMFYEEFAGLAGIVGPGRVLILDDPIKPPRAPTGPNRGKRRTKPPKAKQRHDPPRKPERLCPRHGGPAATCRPCQRNQP